MLQYPINISNRCLQKSLKVNTKILHVFNQFNVAMNIAESGMLHQNYVIHFKSDWINMGNNYLICDLLHTGLDKNWGRSGNFISGVLTI